MRIAESNAVNRRRRLTIFPDVYFLIWHFIQAISRTTERYFQAARNFASAMQRTRNRIEPGRPTEGKRTRGRIGRTTYEQLTKTPTRFHPVTWHETLSGSHAP